MQKDEFDFSLNNFFSPLTNFKVIGILIVVGIIVFSNMFFNGFVWDDISYIILNSDFHSLNILHLIGSNIFNSSGLYRPIPTFYFAFLYTLFQEMPFFYHIFQLAIHISNSFLVFYLFKQFFSKKISLFSSLIFLVHPIQVESVSFISSSDNPLFFLFGILALILSLQKNITLKRLIAISGLLLLSLLTKETGLLFLILILFYRVLIKRDIRNFSVASILILLTYILLRFSVGEANSPLITYIPISTLPFLGRLINIPAILFYYIETLVFPYHLVIDQQWIIRSITFHSFYLPLIPVVVLFLLIVLLGLYTFKKNKKVFSGFLFFFLWFSIGLAAHMQLIPLDMTVADRWFYFPIVGLLGLLAITIEVIDLQSKLLRKIFLFSGIILIIMLSIRTIIRNTNWSDEITLYTHDLQIFSNFELELNLGTAYANQGNYKKALEYTNKSIQLFPTEFNYNNLAGIYEKINDTKNAEFYYRKALTFYKYPPAGHKLIVSSIDDGLAWTLLLENKPDKAKEFIRNALIEFPMSGVLWKDLAISEYKLNNREQALHDIKKSILFTDDKETKLIYKDIVNNVQFQLQP